MFSIVWLKGGREVGREDSGLKEADDVVRYARAKVKVVFATFGPKAPDEFRVIDETGHEYARQHISDDLHA